MQLMFVTQGLLLSCISAAKNLIEGTIPDAIRQLTKLVDLELDRNLMYGTLPEWLSELQSLQWLGLSALTGKTRREGSVSVHAAADKLGQGLLELVAETRWIVQVQQLYVLYELCATADCCAI